MNAKQDPIALAEPYLRESVAPEAAPIDAEPEALRAAFKELGDRSLLGLRVPEIWGGSGVSDRAWSASLRPLCLCGLKKSLLPMHDLSRHHLWGDCAARLASSSIPHAVPSWILPLAERRATRGRFPQIRLAARTDSHSPKPCNWECRYPKI